MPRLIGGCCLTLLLACGPGGERPAQGAMDGGASDAAGGTWTMRVMPADRDTTLLTFTMTTTDDTSGWTMNLPSRDPLPVRVVSMTADQITIEAGPYESVFRQGVPVTIRSEMRREGDRITGTTTAQYASGPDSVVQLRMEGTREP